MVPRFQGRGRAEGEGRVIWCKVVKGKGEISWHCACEWSMACGRNRVRKRRALARALAAWKAAAGRGPAPPKGKDRQFPQSHPKAGLQRGLAAPQGGWWIPRPVSSVIT